MVEKSKYDLSKRIAYYFIIVLIVVSIFSYHYKVLPDLMFPSLLFCYGIYILIISLIFKRASSGWGGHYSGDAAFIFGLYAFFITLLISSWMFLLDLFKYSPSVTQLIIAIILALVIPFIIMGIAKRIKKWKKMK